MVSTPRATMYIRCWRYHGMTDNETNIVYMCSHPHAMRTRFADWRLLTQLTYSGVPTHPHHSATTKARNRHCRRATVHQRWALTPPSHVVCATKSPSARHTVTWMNSVWAGLAARTTPNVCAPRGSNTTAFTPARTAARANGLLSCSGVRHSLSSGDTNLWWGDW